jgi:hypothetical protein
MAFSYPLEQTAEKQAKLMSQYWPYLVLLLLAAIVFWLRRIYGVLSGGRERRPRKPIISTPEGERRFIILVNLALIAVFAIFAIGVIGNAIRNPINIYARADTWERASERQKRSFCATLALKSSKGDSAQLYYDQLSKEKEYDTDEKSRWVVVDIVKDIDPGNKILPENGGNQNP